MRNEKLAVMSPDDKKPKTPLSLASDSFTRATFIGWDYWYSVLRHWRIILAVALAITVANAVRVFVQKSVYYSSVAIEAIPRQLALGESAYKEVFQHTSEMFFNTQLEIARTPAVLEFLVNRLGREKVAESLGLERKGQQEWTNDQLYSKLLKSVVLSRKGDTLILQIGVESYSPTGAATLANAWADSLIASNQESSAQQSRATSESISRQVERLKKSIAEKEAKLSVMAQDKQVQILDQRMNVGMQRLEGLTKQLEASQKEIFDRQADSTRIRRSDPSALPEVTGNPSVAAMTQACNAAQQEYAVKSRVFKQGWPGLQQLKEKADEACRQRDLEQRRVYESVAGQAQVALETARSKQASLQEDFDSTRSSVNRFNEQTSDYQTLKSSLENERKLLDQIIQQEQTARLTEAGGLQTGVQMRIVESASPSSVPLRPQRIQSIALSLLVGLALGITLAFGLNYVDEKVHHQLDIERITDFRFLTFIPDETHEDEKLIRNSFRFLWQHISTIGSIRTPPRVLMVTSAQPGEGKTYVSAHLARTLAELGRRVLLLDLDIQRPNLHEAFRLKRDPGLHELLVAGNLNFEIFPSPIPNLTVVPVGHRHNHELSNGLEGPRFIDLLTGAMNRFEYIILDSGPLLLTPETLAGSVGIDGLILVVRAELCSVKSLRLARDLLENMHIPVLGVVLNKVNLKNRYSYYRYYRKYYSTYKQHELQEHSVR